MRRFAITISLAVATTGCNALSTPDQDHLRTFSGHSDSVCSVALSPNGKQIVSGGADGKIKFWEVESGQCLRTLDGHTEWVQSVALSADGRFLASGGRDALVKLWHLESGEQRKTFVGHSELVKSVAYSPDGRLLASCGRGSSIMIWDVASGECLKTLDSGGFFTASAVKFSADSKRVLFAGDALQLWDVEAGECLLTFEGHSDSIGTIAMSGDGTLIASGGSYTDRTIRLWDPETGDCLWKKAFTEREGSAWSLVFVSEGNILVSGHHSGAIRYWDVKSGKHLRTINAHSGAVSSLSADIKGRYLVSGGWDNSIKLWKVSSGEAAGQ